MYQFYVFRGGAAWKIELSFSFLSFVPFLSKQIHPMSLAGKKRAGAVGEWGLCLQMVQVKGRMSI